MITQLSVASLLLDDETQACWLLDSLLNNWNTLVVSLGNSASEGKATLTMDINNIFNEDIRMKDFVGNDTHALMLSLWQIGHMKRNCKILKQGGDKS